MLCCMVAGIVSIIAVKLIHLHVVRSVRENAPVSFGVYNVEHLPARRGLIMDAREEVLTNNVYLSELIGDRFHLRDPKEVTSGLAYSMARHSEGWNELSSEDQEKRVVKYRSKLLAQAASKAKGKQEYKLAQILLEDRGDAKEKLKEGIDMAREKLKELYDPGIAEKYFREHDEYAAKVIASYVEDMSYQDILLKIRQDGVEKPQQRIVLARGLTEEKAEQLKQALEKTRIRGFKIEPVQKRHYANPECLTHILGYVGQQTEGSNKISGVYGLEKQLDNYLQGVDGIRENRKDSRGWIIPSKDDRFKSPVHGDNVKLTIDMELQTIVEEELDKALEEFRSQKGTIIVVEPKTGSIMAMASRPHFNLNTKENMKEGALNFAVQGLYEPGSTLKVVAATAAVDAGKATFNTRIDSSTAQIPGSRPVSDGRRSFGMLTVSEVLKHSSNPGAYRLGARAGWKVYKQYLEAYGFRSRTNIDLPYETLGMCQDLSNLANFSRVTFGYSITTTPLQVAMAYAAIANDGVRMKPRLVDEIYTADGVLKEKVEPEIVTRVMKPKAARDLREALALVTKQGGTARRAAIEGYDVGGKTGTADKVKEGGGYYDPGSGRTTVSFAGMLPAKDPAFVCLVVIDDPRLATGRPGGGSVAAPVFKNVATRLAEALNIPKESSISKPSESGRRNLTAANPGKKIAR